MKVHRLSDRQTVRAWLLAVVIGFGVTFFAYVAVQQSLRLGLNAPQLQIAEDTASKLTQGTTPASTLPDTVVDEAHSLAPFITIVDKNIHVLASSGEINNTVPLPPASAFPAAQQREGNWFTWQHDNNSVRDAAVIVPYGGSHPGYVLVARSMKQMEDTLSHITVLASLTMLGILIASAAIVVLV